MLPFPVEPMLAAATDDLPRGAALRGGCWYEPKFDGYRALVHVGDGGARVQSRRGTDLSASFPDIAAAAAEQLEPGTVLDGELVIWVDGRPEFAALQRRLTRRRGAATLAASEPAHLMLFDVLAVAGRDLRGLPLRRRRTELERVAQRLRPPLQVVPGTDDLDLARQWLRDHGRADVGIEGLVVKGLGTAYAGGQRGWLKHKLRETSEALVGAVVGDAAEPERLVLGRYDDEGLLRIVGSTHALGPRQREELREHLATAGEDHPWPPEVAAGGLGHWGSRDRIALHRVEPVVVVEVAADRAFDHGRWRHLTRYVRVRSDLTPDLVAPYPVG